MNIAPASRRTGLSFRTRGAWCKKIWTSRSTPILYNGYWFLGRPTMEDLRQDLRAVTKKCRPDWDITAPEMRAAWQQGRKENFYPYGKTFLQTLGEQD